MSLLKSIELLGRMFKDAAEARVDLFMAELEWEKFCVGKIIWLKILSAGTLLLAFGCLIGLILELTPDRFDYLVYSVALVLTLSLSLLCHLACTKFIKRKNRPFAATRETLRKDKEKLEWLLRS